MIGLATLLHVPCWVVALFCRATPGLGWPSIPPLCSCKPTWNRTLCHAHCQVAGSSFTTCLFLEIKKCEVSAFSQHSWQLSYCFGHQGAGLWAGTTLMFDGGCLHCSIKLFIFHFTAPCCFFFPVAATRSCSVRWGVRTSGKFTLYMRWKSLQDRVKLSLFKLMKFDLNFIGLK